MPVEGLRTRRCDQHLAARGECGHFATSLAKSPLLVPQRMGAATGMSQGRLISSRLRTKTLLRETPRLHMFTSHIGRIRPVPSANRHPTRTFSPTPPFALRYFSRWGNMLSPTPFLLPSSPYCVSSAVASLLTTLLGDDGPKWSALAPYTTAPDPDLAPSPHLDDAFHNLVAGLLGAHAAAPLAVLAAASWSFAAAGRAGVLAFRLADVRGKAQRAEGELERTYADDILERLTGRTGERGKMKGGDAAGGVVPADGLLRGAPPMAVSALAAAIGGPVQLAAAVGRCCGRRWWSGRNCSQTDGVHGPQRGGLPAKIRCHITYNFVSLLELSSVSLLLSQG